MLHTYSMNEQAHSIMAHAYSRSANANFILSYRSSIKAPIRFEKDVMRITVYSFQADPYII